MNHLLAFVFPGQGSQSLGMQATLAEAHPQVTATYAEATGILHYDLWQVAQKGPETQLNSTSCTQPALLTAGVAVWRVWQALQGSQPKLLAGHSLGEYTALVCAEALTLTDAVALVAQRGRFMQEAVPEGVGAMAAIVGLTDKEVSELCDKAAEDQVVSPVNYNAVGQVVIAGQHAAVERALMLAKSAGAKLAKLLPVSVPSHCILMKPAAERLAHLLASIPVQKPKIPVINNVDVKMVSHPDDIRDALVRQLYHPVRWVETIQMLAAEGVTRVVECGPGKVLAGLIKRIDKTLAVATTEDESAVRAALTI